MRLKRAHVEHHGAGGEGLAAHAVPHAGDRHFQPVGPRIRQRRADVVVAAHATTPCTGVRLRQLASLTVPPRCATARRLDAGRAADVAAAVGAASVCGSSGGQSFGPHRIGGELDSARRTG